LPYTSPNYGLKRLINERIVAKAEERRRAKLEEARQAEIEPEVRQEEETIERQIQADHWLSMAW
jgi:hypothetical protein